jgi:hypothetical protein
VSRTDLESTLERVHRLRSSLVKLDQELRSLPRFGPRASEVQRRTCELLIRSARLKQRAIRRAIETYDIDVSHVRSGVHYSGPGDMRGREGATHRKPNGFVRVEIDDEAFVSPARLGSTIAHVVEVHVNRHHVHGLGYPSADEQLALIYEVEAYDYELASQDRFGLSDEDVGLLQQRRAILVRKLLGTVGGAQATGVDSTSFCPGILPNGCPAG